MTRDQWQQGLDEVARAVLGPNPIRRTPMVRQRGSAALSELADDPRWLPHTDPGRSWDALLDQLEAVGLDVVDARDRE